jgi:hypothetical protein
MDQYITIILRNQFNLFYRFGYTYIPGTFLIGFDGNISSVKREVVELFARMTPFEYDEEYLILHLKKEPNRNDDLFNIQDIVAIYPLSQQAKISIESKIDPRIRLEVPVFKDILPEVESKIEKEEIKKAIDALWTICKIDGNAEDYISNIGIENIYKGLEHRKKGIHANNVGVANYWECLIAYDRYDYFPKSTLGYFYDAGQIFAYSKGQPRFEGSNIHSFLSSLSEQNNNLKMKNIIDLLEKDEQTQKYIAQLTEKQYIVAPLFLTIKDEIRNTDDIYQTNFFKKSDSLKKEFGDSFKYAVILLGSFFGFRKFYDRYYDSLNLRFYKNYTNQNSTENQEQDKPKNREQGKQDSSHKEPFAFTESNNISTTVQEKSNEGLGEKEINSVSNLDESIQKKESIKKTISISRKVNITKKTRKKRTTNEKSNGGGLFSIEGDGEAETNSDR